MTPGIRARERENRDSRERWVRRNRDIDASLPGRTIGSQSRAEPRANIVFTRTHGFAVQIIWYYCTYSTYARAKLFANCHPLPLPLLCHNALRAGFQYPFALMLMPRIVSLCL